MACEDAVFTNSTWLGGCVRSIPKNHDDDVKWRREDGVYTESNNALLLCLDNKVLREVNKESSAAGVWLKLETLYMTKSLANKLYLKDVVPFLYAFRSDHWGNQGLGSSRSKSKGKGTYKLKCYICYSEDHLKKDCPKRKKKESTGFVKKNVGQGYGSEGYDNGNLLMAVSEERQCASWGRKGECTKKTILKDGLSFVLENVRYIPELKRNLISLGLWQRGLYRKVVEWKSNLDLCGVCVSFYTSR
ncbi:retrovirus-related pol polyprotein from transposon TNT 1-94 [Tanacetum coccineum]